MITAAKIQLLPVTNKLFSNKIITKKVITHLFVLL